MFPILYSLGSVQVTHFKRSWITIYFLFEVLKNALLKNISPNKV